MFGVVVTVTGKAKQAKRAHWREKNEPIEQFLLSKAIRQSTTMAANMEDAAVEAEDRCRPRDSIALSIRSSRPRSSLVDNDFQGESSRALQAMLQDIADWDAQQDEPTADDSQPVNQTKDEEYDTNSTDESVTSTESSSPAAEEKDNKIESSIVSSSQQQNKQVRFHSALYHYHPRIIGDNPACGLGVPLSIDWKAIHTTTIDLTNQQDNEEQEQQNNKPTRKTLTSMYLTPQQRFDMCRQELGLTPKQINERCKPVKQARAQRQRTVERLRFQPLHEQLERLQRTVTKKLMCKNVVAQRKALPAVK